MTRDSTTQEAIYVSVGALIDELVRSGLRHFCVCPGSRSTPLAMLIADHPGARLWMHLDERSAAFFGLGLAKTLREPVALVCTSGTPVANFLPAVVEAFYARIPLVVLSADRPHELRDSGAPQTIDQLRLFGPHVKWFFDLEEPEATPELVRHVRTIACRAVETALRAPAGPVHVNCPFREPLVPVAPDGRVGAQESAGAGNAGTRGGGEAGWEGRTDGRPYFSLSHGTRSPDESQLAVLAEALVAAPRGLIVCGPPDVPGLAKPLVELAEALGYPILADPLSGLRCGPHRRTLGLDAYDAFLRDADFAERFAPAVVMRFGAMPTSKPVQLLLERHPSCRHVVVEGEGGWNEPTLLASDVVHADSGPFCELLASLLPDGLADQAERVRWAASWRTANNLARAAIAGRMAELDELFEGKVFAELAELLPDGALLYAGNSMPVRDLDTFFPAGERPIRFLANRGANGIDGVVSSALGASAAGAGPLVLVIGDLSFYHDSNGLLAAKQHRLNATIVLLNNDGGGIFSFLPQATEGGHFETLFGTPHGLDFRPLAETYGAKFSRVASWEQFRSAVRQGLEAGGLTIVEVPTERGRNLALHRELWPLVSAALARDRKPVG